jgi:hypothetical protein
MYSCRFNTAQSGALFVHQSGAPMDSVEKLMLISKLNTSLAFFLNHSTYAVRCAYSALRFKSSSTLTY